jgi:hypothetical protein
VKVGAGIVVGILPVAGVPANAYNRGGQELGAAREDPMDETVAKLTRALADAIAAAVAADARVEACRAEARRSGYELRLTLEATVGVARKGQTPTRRAAKGTTAVTPPAPTRPPLEMTATDRRFLRSLRIAPDVTPERVEE